MNSCAVEIRTTDPDLGLTVALWLVDVLKAFLSANPSGKVVIDDGRLAGRPFRNGGGAFAADDFRARRDEAGAVQVACSSSSIVFRGRLFSETFRKLLVVMGASRDAVPLNHLRVVRLQQRIRRLAAVAMQVNHRSDPCSFLLRVDDFPSPFVRTEEFLRFHRIAAEHGLPYLLAVTPFPDVNGENRDLSPSEVDILHACTSEGAELALHGFSHRSRYRNYASELVGMPVATLRAELKRSDEYFNRHALELIGFVAPYNSYNPMTVGVLAERFQLLCGGPESVVALGYRAGPSFLMQSLYVPSYRDVYDIDVGQLSGLDKLIAEADGLTVPITLHWAKEVRDDFRSFRGLCERLRGRTMRWGDLLSRAAAVRSLHRLQ